MGEEIILPPIEHVGVHTLDQAIKAISGLKCFLFDTKPHICISAKRTKGVYCVYCVEDPEWMEYSIWNGIPEYVYDYAMGEWFGPIEDRHICSEVSGYIRPDDITHWVSYDMLDELESYGSYVKYVAKTVLRERIVT